MLADDVERINYLHQKGSSLELVREEASNFLVENKVIDKNEKTTKNLGKRILRARSSCARQKSLRTHGSDSTTTRETFASAPVELPPADSPITTLLRMYADMTTWKFSYISSCRICPHRRYVEDSSMLHNAEDPSWSGKPVMGEVSFEKCGRCCAENSLRYESKVLEKSKSGIYVVHLDSAQGLNHAPEDSASFNWRGAIFRDGNDHFIAVLRLDSKWLQFDDGKTPQVIEIDPKKCKWRYCYFLFFKE